MAVRSRVPWSLDEIVLRTSSVQTTVLNHMLAQISAGVNTAKIRAGFIKTTEYIESEGFSAGSIGWHIDGDGNAEFNNAIFRGTVIAGAGSQVGFDDITSGENPADLILGNTGTIRSANFVAGSAGWEIEGNGDAEFNDVTIRGTVHASAGSLGTLDVSGFLTIVGGGTFRSSPSGRRVQIDASDDLTLHSGHASETTAGRIYANVPGATTGGLVFESPRISSQSPASLSLVSESGSGASGNSTDTFIGLHANTIEIGAPLIGAPSWNLVTITSRVGFDREIVSNMLIGSGKEIKWVASGTGNARLRESWGVGFDALDARWNLWSQHSIIAGGSGAGTNFGPGRFLTATLSRPQFSHTADSGTGIGLPGNNFVEIWGANVVRAYFGGGDIQFPGAGSTANSALPAWRQDSSSGSALLRLTSSRRFKTRIRDVKDPQKYVDLVKRFRPRHYYSKLRYDDSHQQFLGLIAEEAYEVAPYLTDRPNKDGTVDGVHYEGLVPIFLVVIQNLLRRIEALETV